MTQPTTAAAGGGKAPLGWKDLLRYNDVVLAVVIVLIVAMMLLPIPAVVLDFLLTLNIALAITILLVTLYTQEPLQYSTFPTILLMSTLFRLGLNVSSTRLILLHGEAGQVIHAFGTFVIGGNYVVGILIFIILIAINFIVITSGATRISEVSARFTLDAMPGKQISIDADLNAGLIDNTEAKRRRKMIQKEADFYGTMDGAGKFIRGDAIAAIIITVVNIVGGLIIGVLQQKMSIVEAATVFTTLTVGEGIVAQIPALIISTATGLLVTRTSADQDLSLGSGIAGQMFKNPKVNGIMGALLLCLGLIPGLPNLPFLVVGGIGVGMSVFHHKRMQREELEIEKKEKAAVQQTKTRKRASADSMLDLLSVETLELEIGYRLVPLIEADNGGDLLERIAQIRRQVALEFGFVLPSVRVRDNLQLAPNQYNIKLRGVMIDSGEVMSDMWLAMNTDPENTEPIQGIATKEPAFGLPALWIYEDQKEEAEACGYTIVNASAVVSTHLTELIKRYASEILSRSDTHTLLENLKKTAEPLVTDLIPDSITEAELHVVLQNLLREKVSIRDLVVILESLSYHTRVSKDSDYLTEQCRMALSRSICKQYQNPETGELPSITLSPDVEEQLSNGLSEDGKMFSLSPVFVQNFIGSMNKEIERVVSSIGVQPVVLCGSRVRLPVKRLIDRSLPQIGVISYNEVGPSVRATAVGMVRLEALNPG
ncbi:MAG: flagellar biosynthesis protein FlhA [Cyanobacteria bacterium]|nr:flagellar biosynthesis protein FlhA [Cyanobacteriota bacterium]